MGTSSRHPCCEPAEPLPRAIRTWADREHDGPFLGDVGGASRSYGQFHEAALRWADAFRQAGIRRGDNVPAMVRTSISAQEHWHGLSWLRAVQTGVNTGFRGQSLEYILANSQAKRMICAAEFLDRVAEVAPHVGLELVIVSDSEAADLPAGFPLPLVAASELWDAAEPATGLAAPQRPEIACLSSTPATT